MSRILASALLAAVAPIWSQNSSSLAPGQSIEVQLARLAKANKGVNPLPLLERLCNGIGPRLTGSVSGEIASRMVLETLRTIGLSHVHAETWTLQRAWNRGPATASLAAPFTLPIPIASYGWTGSTPIHEGIVEVTLVDADDVADHLESLVRSQGPGWRGKALFISSHPEKPMREYSKLLPLLQAATDAHAIAVLRHDTRPGNGIVHSEPVAAILPEQPTVNLLPAVDLPAEHAQLIESLLKQGRPVRIDIEVKNRFSDTPLESSNIVGEILGASHPDEVVLLAAHLDSWDLGTGAADDGFGVTALLGAAESLIKSGLQPARTIRFVFFTGEEQGLLGSHAYVRQHKNELDKLVAVFALDWGSGPIVQLPTAGHPELLPLLTRFNELVPELGLKAPNTGYLFMTDAYSFTLEGLPGISALVESRGYSEHAHSAEDTFDKVLSADLRQAMATMAMASFFLASAADLPHTRFSPEQLRAALVEGKQQSVLESFGLWRF